MGESQNGSGKRVSPRLCVVTAGGQVPAVIINILGDAYSPVDVIRERGESRQDLLRRRARSLGRVRLAGQAAMLSFITWAKRLAGRRVRARLAKAGLRPQVDAHHRVHDVGSVNSPEFLQRVAEFAPDLILLCGCRIVRADVLAQLTMPVLNYHAGITPAYRGMNGGYWALACGDTANFGSTIHVVDAGVDTARIVAQVRGSPVSGDGIWSYAYSQAEISRQMLVEAVQNVLAGTAETREPEGPSHQWYDPEIWSYLWTGVTKRVW
jgi:folate-dependent phosphoribosylglycinamide formyltransferase PurN